MVGSHIVRAALAQGYSVRGTMRDVAGGDKAPYLQALPGAAERLTLFSAEMAQSEMEATLNSPGAEGEFDPQSTDSPFDFGNSMSG